MRKKLIAASVLALLALVAIVSTYRSAPPSASTEAQLRRAVLDYESARQLVWPSDLVGKRLTESDRERLQREYLDRMKGVAAGSALDAAESSSRDVAYLLSAGSRQGKEYCTAARCRIVVWDVRYRELDGDYVVRAGAQVTETRGTWDQSRDRLVAVHSKAYPVAAVADYTLEKRDGRWIVTAEDGSPTDYDVLTHTYGNG